MSDYDKYPTITSSHKIYIDPSRWTRNYNNEYAYMNANEYAPGPNNFLSNENKNRERRKELNYLFKALEAGLVRQIARAPRPIRDKKKWQQEREQEDILHPESSDYDGNTFLCLAIEYENYELINKLLEYGANVNRPSSNGEYPISIAINKKLPSIVKKLLERGADPNVIYSVIYDEYRGLERLETTLSHAALKQSFDIVRMLLDAGVNPNVIGNGITRTPLTYAARAKTEILDLLLKRGADVHIPNEVGRYPLYQAVERKKVPNIKLLLEHGAAADINTPDSKGNTPLLEAIQLKGKKSNAYLYNSYDSDDVNIIKLLLENGASPNIQISTGDTPLHLALKAPKGFTDNKKHILILMAQSGANPNVQNSTGDTPIHLAADDDSDVLKLLLKKGGDVHIPNEKGKVPLHIAAMKGDLTNIKLLLKHGAIDVINSVDNEGNTPLLDLLRSGNSYYRYSTEELIEKGASINVENSSGQTPLYLVARWGNKDVLRYLLDKPITVTYRNKIVAQARQTPPIFNQEIINIILEKFISGPDLVPLLRFAEELEVVEIPKDTQNSISWEDLKVGDDVVIITVIEQNNKQYKYYYLLDSLNTWFKSQTGTDLKNPLTNKKIGTKTSPTPVDNVIIQRGQVTSVLNSNTGSSTATNAATNGATSTATNALGGKRRHRKFKTRRLRRKNRRTAKTKRYH